MSEKEPEITPEQVFELQAEFCQMMAHPKRIELFDLLGTQEYNVSTLAEKLNITIPAVSQHLRLLRETGVVSTRRDAQTIYYAIKNPKLLDGCGILHEFLVEELKKRNQGNITRYS